MSGTVSEIHDENAILILYPEKARAVISLRNIANARKLPVDELKSSIKEGERIDDLVVVSRNLDKGVLIVANRPSAKPAKETQSQLRLDILSVGSQVEGRVSKHIRQCAVIKYAGRVSGALHLTDTADDFSKATLPEVGSVIRACVVDIDKGHKRMTLSTRDSRLLTDKAGEIADKEFGCIEDLSLGDTVRGFVKNVTDHGIFVTLGRSIDARIQIKELYDDVRQPPTAFLQWILTAV